MKALEEKIIREGIVKKGNILKVDSFLNHQIDVAFLDEMGMDKFDEFEYLEKTKGIISQDNFIVEKEK